MFLSLERCASMAARLVPSTKTRFLVAASIACALLTVPLPIGHAQVTQTVAPDANTRAKGDISGDWQGTIEAGKSLRVVAKIAKADKGFSAKFYSLDQGTPPLSVSSLTVDGNSVKMTIDLIGGSFEGTLSGDGNSMTGSWKQGANTLPLTMVRATKETAWEIPAPTPPPKNMPADADPTFDVATIKPNDSGAPGLQGLGFRGRNFATRNTSLGDLIGFAYNVQAKQITGGPDWLDKDRYDISGTPDIDGVPNVVQMRLMVRKLLKDRFQLSFHREKRDMSAFVLSVAKSGQKLKPSEIAASGPGVGMRPGNGGLTLVVMNGSLEEFATMLQMIVLDRPVVDQTGLAGRFDINLTFTPDDSQFNGHPPAMPKADSTESAPSLFEAIQQQIGLKLEAQKTAVEVIAIDHVEKPSAN